MLEARSTLVGAAVVPPATAQGPVPPAADVPTRTMPPIPDPAASGRDRA
jgi:hypothetical protein